MKIDNEAESVRSHKREEGKMEQPEEEKKNPPGVLFSLSLSLSVRAMENPTEMMLWRRVYKCSEKENDKVCETCAVLLTHLSLSLSLACLKISEAVSF